MKLELQGYEVTSTAVHLPRPDGDERRFVAIEGRTVKADGSASTQSEGRQAFFHDDDMPYPEVRNLSLYGEMPAV